MSAVELTEELFAKLVGRRQNGTVLLFEVSSVLAEEMLDEGWSDLVQFRLVRRETGLVDMELRRV